MLTARLPLWPPPDSIVTSTSKGATARSCSSSAAKLRRPTGEARRLRSASTGMTIAVDDSASAAPIVVAAAAVLPSA